MKKTLLFLLIGFGIGLTWNGDAFLPNLTIGHEAMAQFGEYRTVPTRDSRVVEVFTTEATNSCTGVICNGQEWRENPNRRCEDVLWATNCYCNESGDLYPDIELIRDDSSCPPHPDDTDDNGQCTNRYTCPPFYYWEPQNCQCECTGGYWTYVRDCDGDGYFNPYVRPRAFCFGTEHDGWIWLESALGEDCWDSCDPLDHADQVNGKKEYVRDQDEDGYYDATIGEDGIVERCDDSNGYYILYDDSKKKADCDDDDEDIGTEGKYVYDGDSDGWYDGTKGVQTRCPADFWIPQSNALGVDCDDSTDAIRGETLHLYDGDSDGYHNDRTPAEIRCIDNSDNWIEEGSSQGIDCDDEDADINQKIVYYRDKDCDGLGDVNDTKLFCPGEQDAGYVLDNSDDDDSPLWKKDKDGDLYTDATAGEISGCKPGEDWIKSHLSLGDDCDDTKAWLNMIHTWYFDEDGDGYYVDTQDACSSPGPGWNRYSNVGSDLNDNNVFVNEGSCVGDFIIPSLIKDAPDPETGEMSGEFVNIRGTVYRKSYVSINYRGVVFQLQDILFDGVQPQARLDPDKLLVRSNNAIIGGTINIEGESSSASPPGARVTGTDPPDRSEWMQLRIDEWQGHSYATGAITIDPLNNIFKDDFQQSHVTEIFSEAANKLSRAGLTVEINVFEDEGSDPDNHGPITTTPKFSQTQGTGDPHVSISLRKTLMGTIEYVVAINDEVFTPSDEALSRKGWTRSTELDEARTLLSLNRVDMVNSLAHRYPKFTFDPITAPTAPEERFDMPPEDYPSYEAGYLGFFEGLLEYLSYTKILITDLEVPRGSYDSHNEPTEYNDWKVHSLGSVAGIYDTGLEEIRDFVELTRLAESMFDEKFWNQVLESLRNFNLADFAQSQLNQIQEFRDDLYGYNGKPMQYYRGAYTVLKSIKTAITIYKSLGKEFLDTFNPDCSHPDLRNNIIDNVDNQLDDILPDRLHRSDAFTDLSKSKKDKLIEDIASTDDNGLAKDMANNPNFVNSWKKLDDVNHDVRTNTDLLRKIDNRGYDIDQVSDFYANQKAPAGFKGKVDFEATKNVDGADVTIRYDKEGFPDFKDHSPGEGFSVKRSDLDGGIDDFSKANQDLIDRIGSENVEVLNASGSPVLIKIDGKFEGPFTWHHHQDGRTLMPVKQSVHSSFNHSGGRAVIDRGLEDLFESPF